MKRQAKDPAEPEQAQFAERVAAALVARGMLASATVLQRAFNAQNPQLAISVHAARKWLMWRNKFLFKECSTLTKLEGERYKCKDNEKLRKYIVNLKLSFYMKKLIFFMLIMICFSSWAKWEITEVDSSAGVVVYHDKSTRKRSGSVVKMWVMSDYAAEFIDESGIKAKSVKLLLEFDCKSKIATLVTGSAHSGKMGGGSGAGSYTPNQKIKYWLEWPASEIEWKIACEKK